MRTDTMLQRNEVSSYRTLCVVSARSPAKIPNRVIPHAEAAMETEGSSALGVDLFDACRLTSSKRSLTVDPFLFEPLNRVQDRRSSSPDHCRDDSRRSGIFPGDIENCPIAKRRLQCLYYDISVTPACFTFSSGRRPGDGPDFRRTVSHLKKSPRALTLYSQNLEGPTVGTPRHSAVRCFLLT